LTQDEATRLTAKLFAAYEKPRDPLTTAVYVERLTPLDYAISLRAIDELICSEKWLPTVALVLEVHQRLVNSALQSRRALPEAPMTPEQIEVNKRRIEELLASMIRKEAA
jgi:hypothetical protein